jgi:hypothetical protein
VGGVSPASLTPGVEVFVPNARHGGSIRGRYLNIDPLDSTRGFVQVFDGGATVTVPLDTITLASSIDPRVRQTDEPNPRRDAVQALLSSVETQLDALGIPRAVESGELTLLGRVAGLLDVLALATRVEVVATRSSDVVLRLNSDDDRTLTIGDALYLIPENASALAEGLRWPR